MLYAIFQNLYAYQTIVAAFISLSATAFIYSLELKRDLTVLKNEVKSHGTLTKEEIGTFAYESQCLMRKTNRTFMISVVSGFACVLIIIIRFIL